MCILPPPTALHIKITLSYLIIELLVNFISTVKTDIYVLSNSVFGEAAPSTWFGLGLPKKRPLRGSAQFDSKPRTKPVGTHFKHPVVTASSSLSFIRLHQTPIWGVFPPFFPAVKLRDPMHTAKKHFSMYVQYIQYRVQSWLNSRIVSCDGDGVSFPQSV